MPNRRISKNLSHRARRKKVRATIKALHWNKTRARAASMAERTAEEAALIRQTIKDLAFQECKYPVAFEGTRYFCQLGRGHTGQCATHVMGPRGIDGYTWWGSNSEDWQW